MAFLTDKSEPAGPSRMPVKTSTDDVAAGVRFRSFDLSDTARNNLRLAGLTESKFQHKLVDQALFVRSGRSANLVSHVENLVIVAKQISPSSAEVLFVAEQPKLN